MGEPQCTHNDHPGIVRATADEITTHPERRKGQLMHGQWVSSLTFALACCPVAVCDQIDSTADYDYPLLHHPDTDCLLHSNN